MGRGGSYWDINGFWGADWCLLTHYYDYLREGEDRKKSERILFGVGE